MAFSGLAAVARVVFCDTGRPAYTLINPQLIIDKATFEQSEIATEGIHSIFVNGTPVWKNGNYTGQHPGVFLGK